MHYYYCCFLFIYLAASSYFMCFTRSLWVRAAISKTVRPDSLQKKERESSFAKALPFPGHNDMFCCWGEGWEKNTASLTFSHIMATLGDKCNCQSSRRSTVHGTNFCFVFLFLFYMRCVATVVYRSFSCSNGFSVRQFTWGDPNNSASCKPRRRQATDRLSLACMFWQLVVHCFYLGGLSFSLQAHATFMNIWGACSVTRCAIYRTCGQNKGMGIGWQVSLPSPRLEMPGFLLRLLAHLCFLQEQQKQDFSCSGG